MKVVHGTNRTVFLWRKYAIKTPILRFPWRWKLRVTGLLANISERDTWRAFRDRPEGQHLCPVVFSSWGAFIIVMRRATQYPFPQVREYDKHKFTTDHKPENYGILGPEIVCIDYA